MAVRFDGLLAEVLTGTTSATPGTRSTHTHGKSGHTPVWVSVTPTGGANDTDEGTMEVAWVASSTTGITVKSSGVSQPFAALCLFNSGGHRTGQAIA